MISSSNIAVISLIWPTSHTRRLFDVNFVRMRLKFKMEWREQISQNPTSEINPNRGVALKVWPKIPIYETDSYKILNKVF